MEKIETYINATRLDMNNSYTTMAPHLVEKRRLENARECARYFAGLLLRKMSKEQLDKLLPLVVHHKLDVRSATIEQLDISIKSITAYLGIKQFNK